MIRNFGPRHRLYFSTLLCIFSLHCLIIAQCIHFLDRSEINVSTHQQHTMEASAPWSDGELVRGPFNEDIASIVTCPNVIGFCKQSFETIVFSCSFVQRFEKTSFYLRI